MVFDVCKEIETEFIETEVHYVDSRIHILDVNNFLLEFLELVAAVLEVAFFGSREKIVVAGRGEDGGFHSAFNTALELDIVIELDIRPVVDKLYDVICGSYTVNSAETLDDAHRIPVDVVVDEIVAILEVLTLGDAVCSDEYVNLVFCVRNEGIAVL